MKRDYKKYFLGKWYKSAGYRLAFALFIFLYGVLIAARSIHLFPTPWEAFWADVEIVLFESILLFLLPVLIWGKRWQKILALLLSFIPLAILFLILTDVVGLD